MSKQINILVSDERYEQLRQEAFDKRTSISSLLRDSSPVKEVIREIQVPTVREVLVPCTKEHIGNKGQSSIPVGQPGWKMVLQWIKDNTESKDRIHERLCVAVSSYYKQGIEVED